MPTPHWRPLSHPSHKKADSWPWHVGKGDMAVTLLTDYLALLARHAVQLWRGQQHQYGNDAGSNTNLLEHRAVHL